MKLPGRRELMLELGRLDRPTRRRVDRLARRGGGRGDWFLLWLDYLVAALAVANVAVWAFRKFPRLRRAERLNLPIAETAKPLGSEQD